MKKDYKKLVRSDGIEHFVKPTYKPVPDLVLGTMVKLEPVYKRGPEYRQVKYDVKSGVIIGIYPAFFNIKGKPRIGSDAELVESIPFIDIKTGILNVVTC